MNLKKAASSLFFSAALVGCVTEGKDFTSDTNWIKEGRTSQTDVKSLLKEPYSVGNSSGRPTWTYGFYRYKLIGPSHQKELKFYWKPDGTVESFSFNSSFPDDTGKPTKGSAPAPAAPAAPRPSSAAPTSKSEF